jgi:tetratricopeptide (TPR) repeat protein
VNGWALGAAVLSLVLDASPVRAAPSLWQRAREPGAVRQQSILNRVERLLSAAGVPEFDAELSAGAVALLQIGPAPWPCIGRSVSARSSLPPLETALDPRLEYLLGGALLDSQTNREAEARCLLERALRDAPDSPLAAHGLADLAIAAAKLGDRVAEHAAYLRALELTWDPEARANVLANLAESDMALGDLSRSIREYRRALVDAQQPELIAGAYFGLAVALDRSGDFPSALAAAKRAISLPLPATLSPVESVLDLPNVFFTPSYEVHYYKALGAMAAAALASGVVARQAALEEAAAHWAAYLRGAAPEPVPWAPRAALHQASVARELAKMSAHLAEKGTARQVPDSPPLL